jgi:hypothetical protein
MAQPYPGYSCEQVTIVASRILDTIVASGQTRHNIFLSPVLFIGRITTAVYALTDRWLSRSSGVFRYFLLNYGRVYASGS